MSLASEGTDRTVPVWDGRHETWHHFLVEVKWTLSAMKATERPLLAARLIKRNLQAGPAPLVQLLYKLDPSEFREEQDVDRLIRFLESSPLNKQPLPEAGNRIGAYYRRLHRKRHESVRQYIVREEKVHDDMLKALQRLLRERELDFEQYDCSIAELKEFCGMKDGASVYFEDGASFASPSEAGTNPFDEGETESSPGRVPTGSSSSRPATEHSPTKPTPKGKDLLQRLMEKGLMPLSALDVIRGWLLLETCIPGDENGKRMVKAATRNKLTYQEIRSALTNMYEDSQSSQHRHSGKGYHFMMDQSGDDDYWQQFGDHYEDDESGFYHSWDDESWQDLQWQAFESEPSIWAQVDWHENDWQTPEEEHDPSEPGAASEDFKVLFQAQEEAEKHHRELQIMMAENDRNLAEARRAVAAATEDRGWGAGPQQGKGRMTTTYPGKGKGKNKSKQEVNWFKGKYSGNNKGSSKSFSNNRYSSFGKKGGSPFPKGKFGPKGGGSQFVLDADYELMALDATSILAADEHSSDKSKAGKEPIFPFEAILDTGATASAGGQQAVSQLCAAIAQARPQTKITIIEGDKPWFRYGSGTWGQVLFRVNIEVPPKEISIFALPSPGVPVLLGMRELDKLDVFISCKTSKGLVLGECVHFRRTKKMHLVLDFLRHVFTETTSPTTSTTTTSLSGMPSMGHSAHSVTGSPLPETKREEAAHVLELSYDESDFEDCELIGSDDTLLHVHDTVDANTSQTEHLGITQEQWMHLSSSSSNSALPFQTSSSRPVRHVFEQYGSYGGRPKLRAQESDPRGSQGSHGSHGSAAEGQEGNRTQQEGQDGDPVRFHSSPRNRQSQPSSSGDSMAMLWKSHREDWRQPLRPMEGVRKVRFEDDVRAGGSFTSREHSHPSSNECYGSPHSSSFSRMVQEQHRWSTGQVHDRHCGQGESCVESTKGEDVRQDSIGGIQEQGGIPACGDSATGPDRTPDTGDQAGTLSDHGGAQHRFRQQQSEQQLGQQPNRRESLRDGGERHEERQEEQAAWRSEPQGAAPGGVSAPVGSDIHAAEGMDSAEVPLTAEQGTALRSQLSKAADFFAVESLMEFMAEAVEEFHIWELCCSLNSTLTSACLRLRLKALRKTLANGYDFEDTGTAQFLVSEYDAEKPKKAWFSLRCAEWSNIQNINQRNPAQVENLRKKRQKGRKQIKTATQLILHMLNDNPYIHIYWEWPKSAMAGWNSPEVKFLAKEMQRLSANGVFWTQIDGCVFEMLSPENLPIQKSWVVLNTDPEFHAECQRFCPGNHQHRPGGMIGMGSRAVAETAFYPDEMANMIARQWKKQWASFCRQFKDQDIMKPLFQLEQFAAEDLVAEDSDNSLSHVKKETVEMARKLLTKVHRASGHPSNTALARLCRDKRFPDWVVQLAKDLQCDACISVQKGEQKIPNVSLGTKPQPWHMVGLDVFEIPFPQQKCKGRYLLCVCLAMRLMSVVLLQETSLSQTGTDSGRSLIDAFTNGWLMHKPKPLWVVVDAQTSLAKGEFVQFAQFMGFGITAVPGEAHYMHGGTESAVKTVKALMKRFRFEYSNVPPELLGSIAAAAHNNNYMLHGFSPVQWAFGFAPDRDDTVQDPLEVNIQLGTQPNAFWELQQNRERAAELWKQEHAKTTWTKVTNTISRPVRDFQPGDWVCVWRKTTWKMRKKDKDRAAESYNPEARFVGPGRVIFTEPSVLPGGRGSVVWVVMATQVWRCSPDQLRMASESEVNLELLNKGTKLTRPVMDTLKQLTRVTDVTKEGTFDWDQAILPDQPDLEGAPLPEEDMARAQPADQWFRGVQQMSDEWTRRVQERHERGRSRSRSRDKRQPEAKEVEKQVRRWQQLISINENRRREGLPPMMELPEAEDALGEKHVDKRQRVEHFSLEENDVQTNEEAYQQIMMKIEELEQTAKQMSELEQLREMLHFERREEQHLLHLLREACETREEVCEISVDIDRLDLLLQQGFVYTKTLLQGPGKEVIFRQLTPEHKKLFEEAMAREISEVLRSQALRAAQEHISDEDLRNRMIPMRWVLTWKFIPGTAAIERPAATSISTSTSSPSTTSVTTTPSKPNKKKLEVIEESGQYKAKARLVLLGYKHPDLAARDPHTGQRKLATAAPTLTRTARNLLLQSAALDQHTVESADAKSAFLQSERKLEGEPYTLKRLTKWLMHWVWFQERQSKS